MEIKQSFGIGMVKDEVVLKTTTEKSMGLKESLNQLEVMRGELAEVIKKKDDLKKAIGEKRLENELDECEKIIERLQKLDVEWNKAIDKPRKKLYDDLIKQTKEVKAKLSAQMTEDQKKYILRDQVLKTVSSNNGLPEGHSIITRIRREFDAL